METTRDLGRIELWQESLERSLARRGKLTRTSLELYRLQPERDLAMPELLMESTEYWRARRQAAARRSGVPVPVVGLGSVSAVALLAATTLPSILGGRERRGQQLAFAATGQGFRPLHIDRSAQPRPATIVAPRPARPHPRRVTATPISAATTTQAVAEVAPAAPTQPAQSTPSATLHPAAAPKPATHPATQAGPIHRAKPAHHPEVTERTKPATHHHAVPTSPKTDHHASAPKPEHHASAPKPPAPKPAHHAPAPKPHKPAPKPHKPDPKPHKPAPTHHGSKPPKHHSHASSGAYVNPLAHASVTPERIDQGVDYSGTGTLTSIGQARITYVATSNTGWPGAFIEYQLLRGRYAGRFVYYAEGVRPASGISVGRTVRAGQAVAYLIPGWPSGIEIGWGAGIGTETLAAKLGEHTYPTAAGESFSAFIASLGGPPGR